MMTRTREEIQDANALIKAMAVFLASNNLQHHFGDGLKTIAAAVDMIHEEKDPEQGIGLDNLWRRHR
jgi:hypothetical protein